MKKLIGIFTALLLTLCCVLPVSALAAGESFALSLKFDKESYEVGDTVTATLMLDRTDSDESYYIYSLATGKPGNYVRKAMRDCTGEEVCREWLYHIGIPEGRIDALARDACNTTTCFMPYINAFFQPRKNEDRPLVVPTGAVNFAFLGQFAETPRDTIFTTEYSMRTGMEAVYTLLDVDRGVPEVWGSKYDVRELLRACYYGLDQKPLTDAKLSFKERQLLKMVLKKVQGTDIELLLKESGLIR